MSTRSGKRIHGSIHENIVDPDNDTVVSSERKTRSRRLKENCDEVLVPKSKKRHNYVSYPTDDEQNDNTLKVQANVQTKVVKSSKKTLKEKDLNISIKVDEIDSGRTTRHTRRTKKFSENVPEDVPTDIPVVEIVKSKKKDKKSKKKKGVAEVDINENEDVVMVPKKSKKKKGRTSHTITEPEVVTTENFNKSNTSIDSFYSAAGSPNKTLKPKHKPNGSFGQSPHRASKRFIADSCDNDDETQTVTHDKNSKRIKLSHCDELEPNNALSSSHDEANKKNDDTFDKHEKEAELLNTTFEKDSKIKRKSSLKTNPVQEFNTTIEKVKTPNKFNKSNKESEIIRKSLRSTYDKPETPSKVEQLNSTYEKVDTSNEINKTFDGDKSRRKSLRSTFDKSDSQIEGKDNDSTFEKKNKLSEVVNIIDNKVQIKSLRTTFGKMHTPSKKGKELNSTFEKAHTPNKTNSTIEEVKRRSMSLRLSMNVERQAISIDTTFENPKGSVNSPKNIDNFNSTFDKSKDSQQSTSINTTFEKSKDSRQSILNSTFDKETKLNSTFDKPQSQSDTESKSSLISSDNASNVTFDKSDEMSRISITSDDSRTENIVNTTPVLIESSMDESQVLEPSPKNVSQTSDETKLKPSATLLKREGTFTKDGPELVSVSPKSDSSLNKTPVKRMSLPSPGSTPFPFSKSSQKEKCMLNVTRSIEKSLRRSSLIEAAPRQTKVMFCSPVNNPVVVMQQKRKVIKSNLKGSNKSFIFDENVCESVRPSARKRSYTQNDADDVRAKRKRLADDQLQSAARLSRPRTSSATVKQSEPTTPSKKPTTPCKTLPLSNKSEAKVSRTKLPNFAALHQKQFAKMESLDECQVRKAKRAKQLLTPTGALAIIEKSSPRGRATTSAEPPKPTKEGPNKAETETINKSDAETSKKPDTEPSKKSVSDLPKKSEVSLPKKPEIPSKAPKALTLDSLRPGYTRFGFKMNLDVNPFSFPPKTDIKPKATRPNGLLARQPSQPSLAGATTARREVAKQIVMRERSFTSLTDKRKEKRTTIKGVRTNRRFELQMQMRNINA